MIALFCGSRHWSDPEPIAHAIDMLPDLTIVVEGGAPGADTIAREAARERGLHVATVPANWKNGPSAGPRRNCAMLLLRPDVVYAFPFDDSRGTWGMVKLARAAGIEVRVSATTKADKAASTSRTTQEADHDA